MATKKELQEQLDALGAEYGSKDTVAELEERLAAAKAGGSEAAEAEPDGGANEPATSEWRVVGGFRDRHTGDYHKPGDVIEVTDERAGEILSVAALIERA